MENEYLFEFRKKCETKSLNIKEKLDKLFDILSKHFSNFDPGLYSLYSIRTSLEILGKKAMIIPLLDNIHAYNTDDLKARIATISDAKDKEVLVEWLEIAEARQKFNQYTGELKSDAKELGSLLDSRPLSEQIIARVNGVLDSSYVPADELILNEYLSYINHLMTTKKTFCFDQVVSYTKSASQCLAKTLHDNSNGEMKLRCDILVAKAQYGKEQCSAIFSWKTINDDLINEKLREASIVKEDTQNELVGHIEQEAGEL